jgi:hypothetical protein
MALVICMVEETDAILFLISLRLAIILIEWFGAGLKLDFAPLFPLRLSYSVTLY